jgi:hypothetical protein
MIPLTSAEKQARRRENYKLMRATLLAIMEARTLREAKAIAEHALVQVPANSRRTSPEHRG